MKMSRKNRLILDWVERVAGLAAIGWGANALFGPVVAVSICGALIAFGLVVNNYKF